MQHSGFLLQWLLRILQRLRRANFLREAGQIPCIAPTRSTGYGGMDEATTAVFVALVCVMEGMARGQPSAKLDRPTLEN